MASTAGWDSRADVTGESAVGESIRLSGLTNDSEYLIRVRAQVASADGVWASVQGTPRLVPSEPLAVVAARDNEALDVSWSVPSEAGSEVTSYEVRYREMRQESEPVDLWKTHSSTVNGTSWTIDRLRNGTAYEVEVRAHRRGVGSGPWSETAQGTPSTVPDAPGKRVARSAGPETDD